MKTVLPYMAICGCLLIVLMGCAVIDSPVNKPETTALKAFPGAEGWGAVTAGGRGGKVIKVTNLNTSGPGSLAEACATKGPRIVVFDVSGVIPGEVKITEPYLTIAGQTAPGGGITIAGRVSSYDHHVHDVIIRYIRVRPGPTKGSSGDGFQLGGSDTYNFILDHCSAAWGNDEVIDFYWAHDMTVQWCTVEESDNTGHDKKVPHNFGMISAAENSGAVSVHHNLWANHYRRVPCMAPYRENAADDFRNNIVYNVQCGYSHDGHGNRAKSPVNLINNYYRQGPNNKFTMFPFGLHPDMDYYISDNYFENWGYVDHPKHWKPLPHGDVPQWIQFNNGGGELKKPAYVPHITTYDANEAYHMVLAKAGCWPRDRVTKRTIEEVKTKTGSWGRNAPAEPTAEWFMEGLTAGKAPADNDNDGMPDEWEKAHGLNSSDSADATKVVPAGASKGDIHQGYTYIEFYINELADSLVP